jgi:hypothetical protein
VRARIGAVTPHGNHWLRGTLTECAWAASAEKNCFLKDGGYRSQLMILIYQALITGQPYHDKRVPVLDQRQKQRMIRHHIR